MSIELLKVDITDPHAPVWRKPVDITVRLTKYMHPNAKFSHIKRGDRVICNGIRSYFAYEKDGKAFTFDYGRDEWAAQGKIFVHGWNICELWDGKNG